MSVAANQYATVLLLLLRVPVPQLLADHLLGKCCLMTTNTDIKSVLQAQWQPQDALSATHPPPPGVAEGQCSLQGPCWPKMLQVPEQPDPVTALD